MKTGSKYRFDSPVPLVFDNYIGYYRLLRSLEQGKSEYVVELSDQYLMERFLDFSDKPLQLGVSESFKNYLEPTKFIDFMEPAIQRLIAELRKKIGPNTTQFEFIQLLLSEVNSQLVFDSTMEADDAVTTISASDTLKRKSGVCQHFAALFSALSRGLGIPARIINGYHQSSNWDGSVIKGNHAWVEILVDGSKWLPIEPQQKSFEFISSSYLPIAVNPLYEQKDSAKMSDILKSSLSIFRIIKDLHILEIHENEGVRAPYFNHSHEL